MLRQCPGHMFTHQRRRMICATAQRGKNRVRRRSIAKRNRDIAQPALSTDPPDRASGGSVIKFRSIPSEKFEERRGIQTTRSRRLSSAWQKLGELGSLSIFVPWADQLTVITAKDAIPDR